VAVDDDRPGAFKGSAIRRALQEAARRRQLARLRPYLHALRWRKSPAEVALLRRSARAAAQAMQRCMQLSHGGASESAIAATFGALRPPRLGWGWGWGWAGSCPLAYSTLAWTRLLRWW
jgi:Xaa-Pro aminopeptidase